MVVVLNSLLQNTFIQNIFFCTKLIKLINLIILVLVKLIILMK
jgi:hypothetical protein